MNENVRGRVEACTSLLSLQNIHTTSESPTRHPSHTLSLTLKAASLSLAILCGSVGSRQVKWEMKRAMGCAERLLYVQSPRS